MRGSLRLKHNVVGCYVTYHTKKSVWRDSGARELRTIRYSFFLFHFFPIPLCMLEPLCHPLQRVTEFPLCMCVRGT